MKILLATKYYNKLLLNHILDVGNVGLSKIGASSSVLKLSELEFETLS